jgi:hypothetical protein
VSTIRWGEGRPQRAIGGDLCANSWPRLCGHDYLPMLSLIGITIATIVIAR